VPFANYGGKSEVRPEGLEPPALGSGGSTSAVLADSD
jgi:hypothetical protein